MKIEYDIMTAEEEKGRADIPRSAFDAVCFADIAFRRVGTSVLVTKNRYRSVSQYPMTDKDFVNLIIELCKEEYIK